WITIDESRLRARILLSFNRGFLGNSRKDGPGRGILIFPGSAPGRATRSGVRTRNQEEIPDFIHAPFGGRI
ncbi:hypothetical protein MYX75_10900, partial [Acidobacteria bacterium AH-259-A15]|nr:hypothetical protein [Acidobacteria bacterium AH-259-A15]